MKPIDDAYYTPLLFSAADIFERTGKLDRFIELCKKYPEILDAYKNDKSLSHTPPESSAAENNLVIQNFSTFGMTSAIINNDTVNNDESDRETQKRTVLLLRKEKFFEKITNDKAEILAEIENAKPLPSPRKPLLTTLFDYLDERAKKGKGKTGQDGVTRSKVEPESYNR